MTYAGIGTKYVESENIMKSTHTQKIGLIHKLGNTLRGRG